MSSKIEWTEETWNPVVGCDKVSAGCKNCYAIRMAYRLKHIPAMAELYGPVVTKTAGGALNWTGKLGYNEQALFKPLEQKKPTMYFVNSMSDLFHEDVPFEFIDKVFAVMATTPRHTYQVLTKRPEVMVKWFEGYAERVGIKLRDIAYKLDAAGNTHIYEQCRVTDANIMNGKPLPNVWIGVSVEDQKAADARIPLLLQVPAAVRWLSCEPLLGAVDLTKVRQGGWHCHNVLTGQTKSRVQHPGEVFDWAYTYDFGKIDWVVAGGESGPDSRPMHPDWVRGLRDQCVAAGVPFFFKQWGDWAPTNDRHLEEDKKWSCYVNYNGITGACCFCNDLETVVNYNGDITKDCAIIDRVGKKAAGRLLDGVEWNEMPGQLTE